ncbi:hypothetical protein [Actinoplanes sp. NPDC026670]|uniref:hypothetical protein n=1 Tax=Actinoplanes sp. NPDC026670 TaxID=3154700 RepID=UPI0033DB1C6C
MTDRLNVDMALLDAVADRLAQAGGDIDATGAAVPPPPDAGPATADVAEVLSLLCGGAAQLAESLRTSGSRVTEAISRYGQEDAAAGGAIRGAY